MFENISLKNIKGIPISTVETRTLAEMGFPVDAPKQMEAVCSASFDSFHSKLRDTRYSVFGYVEELYVSKVLQYQNKEKSFEYILNELTRYGIDSQELISCLKYSGVYDFTIEETKTLFEEFVYLIETLLPRQLSDIYYSFDLEPNPAYGVFFDLAGASLGLERYSDPGDTRYGQFISHVQDGIKKRFAAGESVLSIYDNTCATKTLIKEALSYAPRNIFQAIDLALFSLSKQFSYRMMERKEENEPDFVVWKNGEKVLNIICLTKEDLDCIQDFPEYISKLAYDEYPILVSGYKLQTRWEFSTTIRKVADHPEYIKTHNECICESFRYNKIIKSSNEAYKYKDTAKLCGCFTCGAIFSASEISEWYYNEDGSGYAYCPECEDYTLLLDSQGYEITEDFLQDLMDYIEDGGYYYD